MLVVTHLGSAVQSRSRRQRYLSRHNAGDHRPCFACKTNAYTIEHEVSDAMHKAKSRKYKKRTQQNIQECVRWSGSSNTSQQVRVLSNGSTGAMNQYLIWEGIVDRDAMTPPQLSTDAPVLDVLEPSVVYFHKPLRHNLDVATADGLQGWQQLAGMQASQHGK